MRSSSSCFFHNFTHYSVLILFVAFSTIYLVTCVDFYRQKPPFVQTCRLRDANFSKCHFKAMRSFVNSLYLEGIPEISKEFDDQEHYIVPDIYWISNNSAAVSVTNNMTNIIMKGFNNFNLTNYKLNTKNFSMRFISERPLIHFEGMYSLDGTILGFPLQGSGDFYIELYNVSCVMHIQNQLYEKEGYTFFNVTDLSATLKPKNLKTRFSNVFNAHSKDLDDNTNEIFNSFWRTLFQAMQPTIEEQTTKYIHNYYRKVFEKIPANFFIEDIPKPAEIYREKV